MREANLDRDIGGDIVFWVEIESPSIQVKTPGSIEIQATSKDQISIYLLFKQRKKKEKEEDR